MAKQIGGSVGLKGKNVSVDVTAVQELLNLSRGRLGGPPQPIAVDGVVGPETVSAISRFQKQNFGWSDGRVDPNGASLAKLNAIADGNGTAPPSSSASPSKGAGGTTSTTHSSGFSSAPIFGPNAETATTQSTWALITSVTGKVKMRFPGSGFLQAFAGFFSTYGQHFNDLRRNGRALDAADDPRRVQFAISLSGRLGDAADERWLETLDRPIYAFCRQLIGNRVSQAALK